MAVAQLRQRRAVLPAHRIRNEIGRTADGISDFGFRFGESLTAAAGISHFHDDGLTPHRCVIIAEFDVVDTGFIRLFGSNRCRFLVTHRTTSPIAAASLSISSFVWTSVTQ